MFIRVTKPSGKFDLIRIDKITQVESVFDNTHTHKNTRLHLGASATIMVQESVLEVEALMNNALRKERRKENVRRNST